MSIATRGITFSTNGAVSGSLSFDGTGHELAVAGSESFDISSQTSYTIEAWVNPAGSGHNRAIVEKDWNPGSTDPSWALWLNTADQLVFSIRYFNYNSNTVIPAGQWTHVAVTANASIWTLFVNGVAVNSGAVGATVPVGGSPVRVGGGDSTGGGNALNYDGLMSNLRITQGVLVYTGNFAVPGAPLTATQTAGTNISAITGTETWLLLNSATQATYIVDSSTNAWSMINTGPVTWSSATPFKKTNITLGVQPNGVGITNYGNPNWTFNPALTGNSLFVGPYNGIPGTDVQANNPEQSISIGQFTAGGAMADISNLILFTVLSVQEDPDDVTADLAAVGVAYVTADLNNPLGTDANSVGWQQNGDIFYNGSVVSSGLPTFVPQDSLDMAFDLAAGVMWMRVNGGDWNGNPKADPAANTGGIAMNIVGTGTYGSATALYPAVGPGAFNFIDEFAVQTTSYSIPAGYKAV